MKTVELRGNSTPCMKRHFAVRTFRLVTWKGSSLSKAQALVPDACWKVLARAVSSPLSGSAWLLIPVCFHILTHLVESGTLQTFPLEMSCECN